MWAYVIDIRALACPRIFMIVRVLAPFPASSVPSVRLLSALAVCVSIRVAIGGRQRRRSQLSPGGSRAHLPRARQGAGVESSVRAAAVHARYAASCK